jgi:hypothetical protein
MEHCCEALKKRLDIDDPITPFSYSPSFRTYSVQSVNHLGKEIIQYCPFCGKKFPEPLNNEWHRILEEDYGVKNTFSAVRNKKKLAEFRTDEWWKNRGL